MSTNIIYHITTLNEWERALVSGSYQPTAYNVEGFMHCCNENQLPGVKERYFKNQVNLVKLYINTAKLTSRLQYDFNQQLQQDFPHVYGPLNTDAVIKVERL